jgi:hypothetical protein
MSWKRSRPGGGGVICPLSSGDRPGCNHRPAAARSAAALAGPVPPGEQQRLGVPVAADYDDLLGAAYEGLCKAALGFEPRRGHRPSSYVVPKVRGELLHHLRDTGFALSISHRLRELWLRARPPLPLHEITIL